MNNYDDIINLPHHVSKTRKPMSMESRAAQFAPFSALTGYEDAIKEKARITEEKIEINEEKQNILNQKLEILEKNIKLKPEVNIIYFIEDEKKEGGRYLNENYCLRRIDKVNQCLIMTNNKKIKFNEILDINIEQLKN